MTAYVADGQISNTPVQMLYPASGYGNPGYSFGSKNLLRPTVKGIVTAVAVATNVVTLSVIIQEGFIPAIGDLISVAGTQTDSGGANVVNVALASVTITATTGVGTFTYAATASNQAKTADEGTFIVLVPEVAEALAVAKGKQFAISGYGISWAYTCPSAPSTIAIQLEGAIDDVDSEYTIIGSSETATSGYNEFFATLPELVRFVRLNVTATTGGTNPTIIGKILNS
jgi:hypothetical protein